MTNMSYVYLMLLVILLQITNLSVSYDINAQVELCFDPIQFLSGMLACYSEYNLTWFHFNTPTQSNFCESDHGSKFFHFDDCKGLGEQISWILFSRYMIRFYDLTFVLFLNTMMSNIYMLSEWLSVHWGEGYND